MSQQVTISKHARQRLKDRMGLGREASLREAQRAWDHGLRREQTTGRLRRYLEKMACAHRIGGQVIRGRFIYIFGRTHLVTVLNLPHEFDRAVDSLLKKNEAT